MCWLITNVDLGAHEEVGDAHVGVALCKGVASIVVAGYRDLENEEIMAGNCRHVHCKVKDIPSELKCLQAENISWNQFLYGNTLHYRKKCFANQ